MDMPYTGVEPLGISNLFIHLYRVILYFENHKEFIRIMEIQDFYLKSYQNGAR
jgi:hypothetical protein